MEQTTKICPICNETIKRHPALSRTDNKTEICSKCGLLQAGQALLNHINTMLALDDIEKVFRQYQDPIQVIVACYLAIRYDDKTCYSLENKDLNAVYKVIRKYGTIFNDELNHEIDVILNRKNNRGGSKKWK